MADGILLNPETIERIRIRMGIARVVEEDLEESFVRGGGSGGQKINKTSSCVRLVHKPTGFQIRCQETRSREANRWLARKMLAEKILEAQKSEESARIQKSEKIRRQKRRRSRRQKERMLAEKHKHSEKKAMRRSVSEDHQN